MPRIRKKKELTPLELTRKLSSTKFIKSPFPLINITKKDCIADFLKLKNGVHKKLTLAHTGNKASNCFFQLCRMKTKKAKHSFFSAWNDKKEQPILVKNALSIHRKDFEKDPKQKITNAMLQTAMRYRYGSINQFKPNVASFIYQKFKPTHVVDFSAGWGDRCCGAMAQDVNYTGIDTNINLKKCYDKMIKTYQPYSKSNINMIFTDSAKVDYSKLGKYDMIFTSPPYFTLEAYQNMPTYDGYDGWVKSFLEPVLINSVKNLDKNGFICLNIPHMNTKEYGNHKGGIYGSVKKILGRKENKKLPLPLHKFVRVYDKTKSTKDTYKEFIFVWYKKDLPKGYPKKIL